MKQIILVSFFRSSLFDCRGVGTIWNRFIVDMAGCLGAVATRLFAIAFALSNSTGIARPQNWSLFSLHVEKDLETIFGKSCHSTIMAKHLVPINCNISMFNDYILKHTDSPRNKLNRLFSFACDVCL